MIDSPHPTEWIAAGAAAFGIGFLFVAAFLDRSPRFLRLCPCMLADAAIGVLGFALHLRGNLLSAARSPARKFLYGAPIFAPLLFTNPALIAAIGVAGLQASTRRVGQRREAGSDGDRPHRSPSMRYSSERVRWTPYA